MSPWGHTKAWVSNIDQRSSLPGSGSFGPANADKLQLWHEIVAEIYYWLNQELGELRSKAAKTGGAGKSWVHSVAEMRELCAHFRPLPTHFSLSIDLAKRCCGQVGCIISIYVTGKFLWRVCSHYAKLKKRIRLSQRELRLDTPKRYFTT